MSVGTKVDRHAVGKKGDVGTVVGIETAQKILVGLSGTAGMFHGDEAGDQPQHLSRSALRLQQNILCQE